jgi:asparagine synthase (glutamine-hydrolysing)
MDASLAALYHRGPDHAASLAERVGGREVALGHTRLSIIDLSAAGNQPMHHAGVSIVLNGEVYNYRELRAAHLGGEALTSSGDTEVVLRLFAKYGTGAITYLNGDFALAVLDRNAQKLHLVRDRLGIKPLYLYRSPGMLVFASEIKAFTAAGLRLTPNREAFGRWLVFKYSPLQETLYHEVTRLAPGHILSIDLHTGVETEGEYWSLRERMAPFRGSYADACATLRDLLGKAVQRRLVADVPISNYLSGGIDSSIIAHYLRGGDHTHYCAVKHRADLHREGTTDDGHYARRLATDWGLHLEEIAIGSNTFTEAHLRAAARACDDPIADGSVIPAILIAREAARHHRVVLSGMGADEIFLGYNGHLLLRLTQYARALPGFKALLAPLLRGVAVGRGPFKAYRRYLQKWGNNLGRDFEAGRFSVVGDVDSAVALFKGPATYAHVFERYFSPGTDPWEGMLHFETENFLVKNLHYLDRASMAYGLESRVPYLDHELVEYAAGLPLHFKLDGRFVAKRILKDAYADVLPVYILKRRKAGFGMPLRALLAQPDRLNSLIPEAWAEETGLFHMDGLRRIKSEHLSGQKDQSALLYAVGVWRAISEQGAAYPFWK